MNRNKLTAIFVTTAAGTLLLLGIPSASAAPTCFGKAATKIGSNNTDVLKGTSAVDVIAGLGGEDTIYGAGSGDFICGGGGEDTLFGQSGADRISGDALATSQGCFFHDDAIFGGPGNDRMYGGVEGDTFAGGTGNDYMNGGEISGCTFTDVVTYETATAPVSVNLATGDATGQGTDTLTEIENVIGSAYGDELTGENEFPNDIYGRNGNDRLYGLGGGDDLFGEEGDDDLYGGSNGYLPDRLFGGSGSDDHFGGPNDDELWIADDVAGNDRGDGGDGVDWCQYDTGDAIASCEVAFAMRR